MAPELACCPARDGARSVVALAQVNGAVYQLLSIAEGASLLRPRGRNHRLVPRRPTVHLDACKHDLVVDERALSRVVDALGLLGWVLLRSLVVNHILIRVVVVCASQLAVDTAQVAAGQVLLLPALPSVEHHLVQHLLVFVRGRVLLLLLLLLGEVHRVRVQRVVEVAHPLLVADALGLSRRLLVEVAIGLGAGDGERLGHNW